MREIEAEINRRRNERENRTVIPVTNFRGIEEIRDFSAEIARLALIIAEYQCGVLHRTRKRFKTSYPFETKTGSRSSMLRIDYLNFARQLNGFKHLEDVSLSRGAKQISKMKGRFTFAGIATWFKKKCQNKLPTIDEIGF